MTWTFSWTNDVGPDDEYYIEFYEILDSKHYRIGTAEEEADARLMAAAPDLLEALKHLEHNARASGAEMGLALDVARAAIKKAEAT